MGGPTHRTFVGTQILGIGERESGAAIPPDRLLPISGDPVSETLSLAHGSSRPYFYPDQDGGSRSVGPRGTATSRSPRAARIPRRHWRPGRPGSGPATRRGPGIPGRRRRPHCRFRRCRRCQPPGVDSGGLRQAWGQAEEELSVAAAAAAAPPVSSRLATGEQDAGAGAGSLAGTGEGHAGRGRGPFPHPPLRGVPENQRLQTRVPGLAAAASSI